MALSRDLAKDLRLASEFAREGGALVLKYRAAATADPAGLGVTLKPGDEPVTAADWAVNDLLVRRLRAAFPRDALLSEELPDDGSRHGAERTWLVDPIDGTKDFIAGRPGFAVMIGLLIAGRPVLGVVYQPLEDTLYLAAKGGGAFRQRGGGAAEPLRVSMVGTLGEVRMVSSASHPTRVVAAMRAQARIPDELTIGSIGIKLSLIAAGERDLYVNPTGRTKLWDTCGPEVILEEAGGQLTDAEGGPLDYRGADLSHPRGLVASNGRVHEEALARLRPLLPGGGTRI